MGWVHISLWLKLKSSSMFYLSYCKCSSQLLSEDQFSVAYLFSRYSEMIRENTYPLIMLTLVVIPLNDLCSRKPMKLHDIRAQVTGLKLEWSHSQPTPLQTEMLLEEKVFEGTRNQCLCFPGRLSPLLRPMVCWRQQYKIDFTLSRLLHSLLLYTIKTSTALANNLGIPWKHAQ